jgi:serine/threonine protein phosphatase PrpC
VIPLS